MAKERLGEMETVQTGKLHKAGLGWKVLRTGNATWLLVLVLLFLFPTFFPDLFYIRLVNEMLIFGLVALSLDVMLGYTGMLSFMPNTYMGVSAYIIGIFLIHISPESLWIAFLVGIIATSLIALVVGLVQVRIGGLGFALLTVAFGMMFYTIAFKWDAVTGGDNGLMGVPLPNIKFFGVMLGNLGDTSVMYYFSISIVAISYFIARKIVSSPFGAVLEAIREDEELASYIGIDVYKYKLLGWMLSCMLASVSGALFIMYQGYINPDTLGPFCGAGILMMVLLGGLGTLWGPIVGAGIFIFLQDYVSALTQNWEVFVGLIVVLLVLFMPEGIAGIYYHLANRWRESRRHDDNGLANE